jgi:YHS domain-containing protein
MKLNKHVLTAMLLTGLAAGTLSLCADEKHDDHKAHKDADAKPYPTATCLISGEKLDSMGKPVVMVVDGQEIKFCCKNCLKDYNADKAGYMKKLAKAEADAKPYTLKTCVVSGDEFDHGKPYPFAYQGQQVKLCCTDCLADFKKEPAKFMTKIADAQKTADKK